MVERRLIFPNQRAKDLYNLLIEEAYTVELEAELSMLKEENRRLKQIQAEMMQRRRQMLLAALEKEEEEQQAKKKQKRKGGKQLRRCNSGPL
ncbi:hypothetical protein QJS04_geneDACA008485 [Acorus gramineus]|uniref:Uncharacterized protein n=1 Tax=Acorus gramineus TaxID=55184 RepID=A0AAV9AGS5_ACOGR|nr:hypothetical protein QJS04_geneDACA008485 [Acorus gramineus]